MTFKSLHAPNASQLLLAVEEASYDTTFSINFDLRALDDPITTPAAFLPFLGWSKSTDLWDRSWPEEKKRAVIQSWYKLHSLKGTLTGIKEAVRFFDAEVASARVPPDGFYPSRDLTSDEWEAYVGRFRQLRVYNYRSRGRQNFGAYEGGGYQLPGLYPGYFFPAFSDVAARIGRRAFVYDPATGIETALTTVTVETQTSEGTAVRFDQVFLPGTSHAGFFPDTGPQAQIFVTENNASGRIYTVSTDTTYVESTSDLKVSTIQPSMTPIDVRPRRVTERGTASHGQMFPSTSPFFSAVGTGDARKFLPPSTASERIYEVTYLYERGRQVTAVKGSAFANHVRLGMPPYNARLKVKIRRERSKHAFGEFVYGFLMPERTGEDVKILDAIDQQKSLRDKIIVSTRTKRPLKVADAAKVGTVTASTWVDDL